MISPLVLSAINNVGATLDIVATSPAPPAVVLTHKTQGVFANTRTLISTNTGWTLSGATMTGGVGGGGAGVIVYGGLGDDTLTGSAGDDSLYGDLGTDLLSGGNSATDSDVLVGGAPYADGGGLDTVTYAARTFPLTVNLGGGVDQSLMGLDLGSLGDDVWQSFVAGQTGPLTAISFMTNGAPTLTGTVTIYSGTGVGGAVLATQAFTMTSWSNAWFDVTFATRAAVTAGGTYTFRVQSTGGFGHQIHTGNAYPNGSYYSIDYGTVAGWDMLFKTWVAVPSGEVHETDSINVDVEIVIGGSGNDTFSGGPGPQTFYGGPGNDTFLMNTLVGMGAGSDTFWGGTGIDTVDYSNRTGAVTVTMDGVAANDGEVGENDNIQADIENFICPTGAWVCTVTGNALDNTITGGAGADVLSGGAGDDTFVMGPNGGIGAGADQVSGGAGVDTMTFATFGATINVIMDGTASTTMGKKINTDVENLICDLTIACTVTGNAANNKIVGSSSADTITSMDGDDNVEGNGGDDVVDCGDGSDILTGKATMVSTPPVACEL